jgi:hypothetical protein
LVYHVGGGTLPATSPFKLFLNFRNNLLMLENNLAKTFALEEYRNGKPFKTAAKRGIKRARRRIRARICLDFMSAAVYLMTFRFDCFRSVYRAHKEYKVLTTHPDADQIKLYLQNYWNEATVTGIYRKWIVLQSMLKGSHIFNSIADKDFYKI